MKTSVQTWLIGLQTVILVASIPWAYSMHGRTVALEQHVKGLAPAIQQITDVRERVLVLEYKTGVKKTD